MHRPNVWKLTRRVVRNALSGIGDDELMTRAAALAFYSALSFAPLLVLALWVVSSVGPTWQRELIEQITHTVGPRAADAVRMVIDNVSHKKTAGHWAGLIGLAVTLFSASAVFAQLQGAINRVWGLRAQPGRAWVWWLRARIHAFGLLAALAFLLVITFAVSAVIAALVPDGSVAWSVLDLLISLGVFTLIFAAIFKVLPDALIDWRDALIGAALTAALFAAGKFGIGLYLANSNVGGAYGPASSVIVLLVWVYFAAVIILLGAELTEAVAAERGCPIRPRAYAEPHHESTRRRHGSRPWHHGEQSGQDDG
ncbi:YihY/virulence factor BrkB family protein [Oleiagrimonas sp. C23AA]|uniref:YihY/virulence factor BrkB family protein n=1 Tax=Oleiagrimonas sp. C23AA TaxID=2719047 RepID=UPI00141F9A8C|nr:YihY/virulence factor BrkB family protein [Oleiagrimonas sp. C23AA]NII11934.1 YihY/virulence factor BrkB family protein [Oleiagrimonas sp. C23AA]